MNRFYKILSSRWFSWPCLILPGVWWIVVPALKHRLGINPLLELLHRSGDLAVWIFAAVLALTPLKTLFPRMRLVAALNCHRRPVGVAAFIYAGIHVIAHFTYEGQFAGFLGNLRIPFFFTGTFGFVVLTLLAVTSNDFSIRRLNYKFWKWLHTLVYFAALAIALHVGLMGKGNWTFARKVFVPLLALQALRVIWQLVQRVRQSNEWKDWREFEIARREPESETICSFYLRPVNGRKLPPFKPGQFLTLQLEIPGQPKAIVRPYTISGMKDQMTYRVSIKREPPGSPGLQPGLASNHFHDQMQPGSRLRTKPPAGRFCLDTSSNRPIILLSAGVGITPMVAMLNALVTDGDPRTICFLHGARNRCEHAFGKFIRDIAAKHPNVHAHITYSQPEPGDVAENFCHSEGRLDIALVKQLAPGPDCDFYLCGPGSFMKSFYDGLREWGVLQQRIHYEFFGPASVKFDNAESAREKAPAENSVQIHFEPKGISATWNGTQTNLLDFALGAGLKPRYGCKNGICGTCLCRLISGEVRYDHQVSTPVAKGEVLLCCARPESHLTIAFD